MYMSQKKTSPLSNNRQSASTLHQLEKLYRIIRGQKHCLWKLPSLTRVCSQLLQFYCRNIHRQTLNALHILGGSGAGPGAGRGGAVHVIRKNPDFDLTLFLQRSWHLPQPLHPIEQPVDEVLWSSKHLINKQLLTLEFYQIFRGKHYNWLYWTKAHFCHTKKIMLW